MTRLALFILLVCSLVISVLPQTRRARTAPAIKNDTVTKRKAPALPDPMNLPPPPPATTKAADDEVVRVETNLVTTPVSVLDRNGRFIPGLKKKDFKIFEDGVSQEITYFQSSELPFTVILLIDTSPSTRYHIDQIHFAALTFVNQLRPEDKVMVVAFDSRMRILSEATTERPSIFAAIYKSQFGSGTSLYDAVDQVANLDLVSVPGRKAVVLFTDGVDTTSRRADYASSIASVEEVDALFYPIRYDTQRRNGDSAQLNQVLQQYGVPANVIANLGRGQSSQEYATGRTYLETLATNTGGRIFEADTIPNLEVAFAGVAEELRRQYSIGYYASEEGQVGDRKRIKVQVTRLPKAVIRSKTTYVVKDKDESSGDAAASARAK
jgi:Ca-activated chloride channel homolog